MPAKSPQSDLTDLQTVPSTGDSADPSPEQTQETHSALDELLKAAEGINTEEAAKPEVTEEQAEATAKAKAIIDPATADEKKPDAEEKLADKPAEKSAADDFDKVEIPPHSKPKSVEAFSQVKQMARERIAKAQEEVSALKDQVAKFEEAAKGAGIPPEVQKELDELRAFRKNMDVEFDPSFKQFDADIAANVEAIYAKLSASGTDEESIKKIKEFGGPQEVAWEKLSEKIPASVMRYIENKLFTNEDLAEKKKKAIETAKKNADVFLKGRSDELSKSGELRKKQVEGEMAAMLPQLKWLDEKKPTKPEEKPAADAHNKLVADIKEDIKAAMEDDSPQTRAILIAGFAQLRKVRADYEAFRASHKTEVEGLKEELKKQTDLVERIKKSSTTRLRDSSAPKGEDVPKKATDYNVEPSQAIDDLLKEALASKE